VPQSKVIQTGEWRELQESHGKGINLDPSEIEQVEGVLMFRNIIYRRWPKVEFTEVGVRSFSQVHVIGRLILGLDEGSRRLAH